MGPSIKDVGIFFGFLTPPSPPHVSGFFYFCPLAIFSMIYPFPLQTADVFFGRPLIYHLFPGKISPYILHFEMFIIIIYLNPCQLHQKQKVNYLMI